MTRQHKMTCKLVLGTVQFGMEYGIANVNGRPDTQRVADILALAQEAGVTLLDTAISYGDSEEVLGRVGISGWQVITKLPPLPDDTADIVGWIEAQVTASLSRLGIDRLYGLLLHAPTQMHGARASAIASALESVAAQGLIGRVGVSLQHPDHDLPAVLRHMAPGLIQSPFNLLDDTLVTNGWAAQLRGMDCKVHTRSAFLQGLLLMDRAARPAYFDRWAGHWQVWHGWLERTGLSAPDACLRFVRAQPHIDACIIGVDSAAQLKDLLATGDGALPDLPSWPGPADADLITPSRWIP